jgi:hypothetical protein
MRITALAITALALIAATPAMAQSLAGDRIELDLALWRHQPEVPPDLVDAGALLLEPAGSPRVRQAGFDQALTLRAWRDMDPAHSPAQARTVAMGRRSSQ